MTPFLVNQRQLFSSTIFRRKSRKSAAASPIPRHKLHKAWTVRLIAQPSPDLPPNYGQNLLGSSVKKHFNNSNRPVPDADVPGI